MTGFRPRRQLQEVANAPRFPERLTREGAMGPTACGLVAARSTGWIEGPRGLLHGLLRRALVFCADIVRLYADAGYDSADNRRHCRDNDILLLIRKIG